MRKSSRRQSFASKVLISVKYSFNLGTRGHRMFQDWDCAHYNPSVTFGNDAYISFKGILLAHTHRTGIIYTLCMTMPPCRVDITEFIHSLFRIEYHKYVSLSISFLKMFLNVLIGYRCQSSQHLVCLSIQKNHQLSLLYIHNRGFLDLNIIRHFNWGLYLFFFFAKTHMRWRQLSSAANIFIYLLGFNFKSWQHHSERPNFLFMLQDACIKYCT